MADESEPSGLDSAKWSAIFGLVLDALRATPAPDPLTGAPVEPVVGRAHHAEHAVDEPGEGTLVGEDDR